MKSSTIALSKIPGYCTTLFGLTMLTSFVLVGPLSAQSQKWDATYVAEDTYFMIGLNVQHLLEYEKADSPLRKEVTEMLQEGMGINVAELEQFQFMMGGEDDEDMLQIKLTFNKPQKFDSLLEKLFGRGDHELAERAGMKYFKSTNEPTPSVYAPTDKMMVIANENRLLTLMDSKDSMGDLVERIKQANGNADLFLTFEHNDMTKRMVGLLAKQLEGLPFDIEDIASEAKHGSLTVDLADDKPLIGTIEAKDQEGAERLKRAADALVALGKTGIPTMKRRLDAQAAEEFDDEELSKLIKEQMAEARKGLALVETALDGTTVETAGNQVELKVAVMGGVADWARMIAQMIGVKASSRPQAIEVEELDIPRLEEDDRPEEK